MPPTISEAQMAATDVRSIVLTVLSLVLILGAVYLVDPTMFGLLARKGRDGFVGGDAPPPGASQNYREDSTKDIPGKVQEAITQLTNAYSQGGDKKSGPAPSKGPAHSEEFADIGDVTGPAAFDNAEGPAGCYPRDQLTPSELLPKDPNSVWAQQNPMGTGSLKGKNFLSAGALIGVNTVGQSLRNANYQLRSEPPNPQVPVSVFYNSTIEPDTNRRDMEIN